MKTNKNFLKITLGVFLMTTVIAFANNNDPIKKSKKSATVEMAILESPIELNKEYITLVHENSSQKEAEFLSGIISEWDVRTSPKFDARKNEFTTVFKSNKGMAEVTYDSEGRVVNVEKRLKNVILPTQISQLMAKRYEDWVIVGNQYNVSYNYGSDVEKTYVLTIQYGTEKKRIRVKG
ncbi:hypothetical protein [Lutimonas sp.]|uniref:hypothetical protein n=1 Tax=Lutimonas sp. TaxID=1872403 RepID=UPI003D9B279C